MKKDYRSAAAKIEQFLNYLKNVKDINFSDLEKEVDAEIESVKKSAGGLNDVAVLQPKKSPIDEYIANQSSLGVWGNTPTIKKIELLITLYPECDRIDGENTPIYQANRKNYDLVYNFLLNLGLPTTKPIMVRGKTKYEACDWTSSLYSLFITNQASYRSQLDSKIRDLQSQQAREQEELTKKRAVQAENERKNNILIKITELKIKYNLTNIHDNVSLLDSFSMLDKNLAIWHFLLKIKNSNATSQQGAEMLNKVIVSLNIEDDQIKNLAINFDVSDIHYDLTDQYWELIDKTLRADYNALAGYLQQLN